MEEHEKADDFSATTLKTSNERTNLFPPRSDHRPGSLGYLTDKQLCQTSHLVQFRLRFSGFQLQVQVQVQAEFDQIAAGLSHTSLCHGLNIETVHRKKSPDER